MFSFGRVSRVTIPTFGSWHDVSTKLFWRAIFVNSCRASLDRFTNEHERLAESCMKRLTAAAAGALRFALAAVVGSTLTSRPSATSSIFGV